MASRVATQTRFIRHAHWQDDGNCVAERLHVYRWFQWRGVMANTRVVLTSAISLVGTIVVSAQIGTAGQQAATSNTTTGGSVTVTGCLQGGTGSTTGTTVTARPGGSSPFVLTNTTSNPGGTSVTGGPAASGTSGAAGATGGAGRPGTADSGGSNTASSNSQNSTGPPRYILDGFDTELAQHVGHRIEVTGTLTSPAPSTADARPAREPNPATPGAAPSGRTDASGSASSVPQRVQVTGVRMIASTCSGR